MTTKWATLYGYEILGTVVFVGSTDGPVGEHIHRLLAPFAGPSDSTPGEMPSFSLVGGKGKHDLYADGDRLVGSGSWSRLIRLLLMDINRMALGNYAHFACHAGVVATSSAAIAFPSRSGGGKSTLTAACLLVGFDYVSDEALCLHLRSDEVIPYPKPLGLSAWSRRQLGLEGANFSYAPDGEEAFIAPEDMGARIVSAPLPLSDVVLIQREKGALELEPAARTETVTTLIRRSFNHYKHPGDSFRLVTAQAQSGRAWHLTFEDPTAAARLLRDRLMS